RSVAAADGGRCASRAGCGGAIRSTSGRELLAVSRAGDPDTPGSGDLCTVVQASIILKPDQNVHCRPALPQPAESMCGIAGYARTRLRSSARPTLAFLLVVPRHFRPRLH